MRMFGIAAAVAMLTAGIVPVTQAAASGLAAHRAVYDLSLKSASERSGISGMSGRMVYEFNGSACEGYTVSFRFVTEITTMDESRISDQQTTTFEDVRNRTFRFVTRSFVNQQLDREIRGSASAGGEGLAVTLQQPEAKALTIPEARFPTEHMVEMITRAEDGERFYQSRIYDGSDDGDQAMITTTIMGAKKTPDPDDSEVAAAGAVAADTFWPVSMAYFNAEAQGDDLPVYSIAFKLYDNGVTRDLTMDYGDFVLEGRLAQLDMFDPVPCEE